jgi:radical SAM superfamily enzyme YgiQ (UPF0313 family)
MRILFIRPNISHKKSSDAMQPLVFSILDALTPGRYEKIFMDDCIEEIDFNIQVDLVAITVGTYAAKRAYEIASKFRTKGATIIMGGFHVSAVPEEALQYAHSVVIGDAEPVWQQVMDDFESQQLKSIYEAIHTTQVLHTRFNRQVFHGKKYFPANLVQWGRGCKHNCDFCSIKAFYGHQCPLRPIPEVLEEIRNLDAKTIFFVDDNLYRSRELFIEFLNGMIPLKKKWACQISVDVAKDKDLILWMKKAGCIMVLLGIETFNSDNLKLMNKRWNFSRDEYSQAISIFRNLGIMVYGTFIFGYDFDHPDSFQPMVDFAIQNKLFLANFNPLYPMPGTPLYQRLKAENRLSFEHWWLDPDFYYGKTKFQPLGMTSEQLEAGCFNSKKQFNNYSSIFYRLLEFKANARSFKNIFLFLLINLINRKEIYRKQHLKLG